MDIFLAEMIGTFLLILLGNGCVANVLLKGSKGENGGWIVISAGWGFGVAMAIYVIGWASGGHINPAVTLGFCLLGKTPWDQFPYYFSGQMLGAMLGATAVWITYYSHFKRSEDEHKKLMCFATKPQIFRPIWNCITEIIATAVLLLGVLGIFDHHSEVSKGLGPYLVGILIFSIGLSLGGPTGFAINPARDLGPRIMHSLLPIPEKGSSEWSYAWIPFFAPWIGSALGVWIYQTFISWLAPMAPVGP